MNLTPADPAKLLDTFESVGRVIRKGDRVQVRTRHGTNGVGTVLGIRDNYTHCPDTIVVQMDPETEWRSEGLQKPWPTDEQRANTFGLFGGEIVCVIGTLH